MKAYEFRSEHTNLSMWDSTCKPGILNRMTILVTIFFIKWENRKKHCFTEYEGKYDNAFKRIPGFSDVQCRTLFLGCHPIFVCFFELDSSSQLLSLQHFHEPYPTNTYLFSVIISCRPCQLQSQEHRQSYENYA